MKVYSQILEEVTNNTDVTLHCIIIIKYKDQQYLPLRLMTVSHSDFYYFSFLRSFHILLARN